MTAAREVTRSGDRASLPVASGLLGVATVVTRLAILVVLALLTRGSGTAAVGYYGLATLAASLAATALSFGLPTYLTRNVPAGLVAAPTVVRVHLARLAILGLATVIATPLAIGLLPGNIRYGIVLVFVASLLEQWNETAWPLIRGTRKAWLEPLVNASTGALLVVVCLVDAWHDGLTFADAARYLFGAAIIRAVAAWFAVGAHRLVRAPGRSDLRKHTRGALPYLASDLLGLLYFRGDVFVLAVLASAAQVGQYVSATALIGPAVQVAAAMGVGALAYASSRLLVGQPDTGDSSVVFLFFRLAGLAAAGAMYLALPVVTTILFGDDGGVLVPAMILTAFLALRFANFGLSSILLAHGRAGSRLVVLVLSICGNVALNFGLDGRYGVYGAAWAAVLTELIVGASFLWFLRSRSLLAPAVATAMSVLAMAAVMAALVESIGGALAAPITGVLFLAAAAVGLAFERRAVRRAQVLENA
jgi:O-antigen/teichoic acid export membrane protein